MSREKKNKINNKNQNDYYSYKKIRIDIQLNRVTVDKNLLSSQSECNQFNRKTD